LNFGFLFTAFKMESRRDSKEDIVSVADILAYTLVNYYILEAVQDEDMPCYANKAVATLPI
jgi:hypothetical protein